MAIIMDYKEGFSGRSGGICERFYEICVCNTETQEIQRKEKLVAKSGALAASRARETCWPRTAGKVFLLFILHPFEYMTLICFFAGLKDNVGLESCLFLQWGVILKIIFG